MMSEYEEYQSSSEDERTTRDLLYPELANKAIADDLYLDCLSLLKALSRDHGHDGMIDKVLFREQLGRFYLWGQDFQDGKLDFLINRSPELRNTVLRFLVTLANITIKSKCSLTRLEHGNSYLSEECSIHFWQPSVLPFLYPHWIPLSHHMT